jgi:hypothetical protein
MMTLPEGFSSDDTGGIFSLGLEQLKSKNVIEATIGNEVPLISRLKIQPVKCTILPFNLKKWIRKTTNLCRKLKAESRKHKEEPDQLLLPLII